MPALLLPTPSSPHIVSCTPLNWTLGLVCLFKLMKHSGSCWRESYTETVHSCRLFLFDSGVTGGECEQEHYPGGTDCNKQFENTTPTKQPIPALISTVPSMYSKLNQEFFHFITPDHHLRDDLHINLISNQYWSVISSFVHLSCVPLFHGINNLRMSTVAIIIHKYYIWKLLDDNFIFPNIFSLLSMKTWLGYIVSSQRKLLRKQAMG